MPLYLFYDETADEYFEELMSNSSRLEFLEENPHIKSIIQAPAIVSGVSGVSHKNDSGFNDLMSRIANANPHSPLADQHGDRGIRATKTRQVVKRQKERQLKSL
jgi:hypothetical protein